MQSVGSPVPSICITPAPPEVIHPDPYSPFSFQRPDVEDDGHRASQLSLPPLPPWQLSSLCPANRPRQGLSLDQFISLLKVSRGQRAQKVPDIHKEPALKSQVSLKQLERRARFLSKLNGPSRTAAISIPDIPLSPCGLESEYSALEIAAGNSMDAVAVNPSEPACDIEGTPLAAEPPRTSSKVPPAIPIKSIRIPPSLSEITARLKPVNASSERDHPLPRLPDLLEAASLLPAATDHQIKSLPIRSLAPNGEMFDTQQAIHSECYRPSTLALGSGHAVVSHAVHVAIGPTLHTTRADTARDMVVILKRRSSPPPDLGRYGCTGASTEVKRCSAPAQLQHGGRVVFVAQ